VDISDVHLILDGLIGEEYYSVPCTPLFYSRCASLFAMVDKSLSAYYVDGQKMTLYQLMQLFEKFKPAGIQRYKGLGEMTVKEIKESMIDPNGNRQLIRLTSDNIKADIDKIRATQSDLSSLFEDVDMSTYKF
jgi:DNA gyrase/topoisomerase IV subunit B